MSKRQGGAAAPPPPLPPGPQPQHDAAAIHAAAWQQYYASQGIISQPAQPAVTPASAPAATNAYQNYGYGPGAGMPGPGSMGVGMNMNMNMGGGAANHMYGRPQNPAMGANMGMNMGHVGHGMAMGGMQMQPGMGMGMQQAQPQYAGMYNQQAALPAQQQQQAVAYGMQAMPNYQQPQQQQPMAMAPAAGPVRPYGRPVQAQLQQPYGAPGPYSSIQPAGPMTPITPSTVRPAGNFSGTRGGSRPGGPGPSPGGPGIGMNGVHNGVGNFPPAKRPRMEGPPGGNRPAGPGVMAGPAAPPAPRSAPAGMENGSRGHPRYGPLSSDFGGSQDGRSAPMSGPPRGSTRGRGMGSGMTRGVSGSGRGRGGSFGAGSSDAGSIRRSPRPSRGALHGPPPSVSSGYRGGRGVKFIPGPGSSSSHAGAPRAPRTGTRGSGSAPGRGGYSSTRGGESYGHHRRYDGHSSGPGSRIPPKAPSGPGGRARSTPSISRATPNKARHEDDEATTAYHEERTRAAREEARKRTMTDFRIIGLEIKQLGWKWGTVRDIPVEDDGEDSAESDVDEKEEQGEDDAAPEDKDIKLEGETKPDVQVPETTKEATEVPVKGEEAIASQSEVAELKEALESSKDDKASVDRTQVESVKAENGVEQDVPESTSEEIVKKRGEKRKAKMSSPDAEDDARIIAKKRNRTMDASTAAPAPEKNRFRIYFASPVERGEGISLKASMAGKMDQGDFKEETLEADEAGSEVEEQERPEDFAAEGQPGDVDEAAYDEQAQEETGEEGQENDQEEPEGLAGDGEENPEVEVDVGAPGADGEEQFEEANPDLEETAAETVEEDPVQEDAQQDDSELKDAAQCELQEEEELGDVSMMTAEGGEEENAGTEAAVHEQPEETAPVEAEAEAEADPATVDDVLVADAQEPTQSQEGESAQVAAAEQEVDGAVAEAQKVELKVSAENTSAAYGARSTRQAPVTPSGPLAHSLTDRPFRRSPSAPPTSSDVPVPTPNRVSILYADGTRRLVLDAAIVESVQIHRKRGMIKVRIGGFRQAVHEKQVENLAKKTGEMNVAVSGAELPAGEVQPGNDVKALEGQEKEKAEETGKPKSPVKGILLEALNEEVNVFGLGSSSMAAGSGEDVPSFPPLDMLTSSETADDIELTAFLDTGNRLSEPKWVKSGHLEDWINSIKSRETADDAEENWRWRKKLEIMDPDAPTTLASVLEGWAYKSKLGSLKERRRFLNSHLLEGHEFVHILTRASHSEDYTPLTHSQFTHTHSILKRTVPPTSVHYGQQSYSSLAVMAVVNLVKEYSAKAREDPSVYQDKIADIIKALPNPVIYLNTDKLFQDWQKHSGSSRRTRKPGK